MPTNYQIRKSDNNITLFEIYPNSGGEAVSITGGTIELYYYENILSETIRVTAKVVDTGNVSSANDGSGGKIGLDDTLKLGNGEKVYLEFEDGQETPNKLSFTTDTNALYLNQKEKLFEHTQQTAYTIELVSGEYLKNESKRVVERYDGKISDHVKKILTDTLETKKQLNIELTDNKFNFIGVSKKPMWNILWLAKKSIPQKQNSEGNSAGYFFFETYDGYVFKSIDTLLSETGGGSSGSKTKYKSYIFNNLDSSTVPLGYDDKIISYEAGNTGDFHNNLMMGTYNSANKGFDARASCYSESPIDISKQVDGITIAGTEFNFTNSLFTKDPSRFTYSFKSVGFLPEGKDLESQLSKSRDLDIDKGKTINQAASRYNQVFTIKLEIIIPGDFSLRAGDIIYCDFPELTSKPTPETNPRMSGIYMISALCHRISAQKTYTSLELIRDSYGRKPKDTSSNTSSQSKGVTQQDIDKAVADENALMADQEKAAAAETPYNNVNYDEEGYNKDLTNADILTEDEAKAQFNR